MNAPPPIKIFTACAEKYALSCAFGEMDIQAAVEGLQSYAEASGLVAELGHDRVQDILAAAFIWAREEADDTIDSDYAAQLVRRFELNDLRDAWQHTGDRPPADDVRNSDISGKPANKPQRRGPPQSTVDAFKYVVSLGDAEYLAKWLRDHSDVAPVLLKQLPEAA
jgi:hypothetical protein